MRNDHQREITNASMPNMHPPGHGETSGTIKETQATVVNQLSVRKKHVLHKTSLLSSPNQKMHQQITATATPVVLVPRKVVKKNKKDDRAFTSAQLPDTLSSPERVLRGESRSQSPCNSETCENGGESFNGKFDFGDAKDICESVEIRFIPNTLNSPESKILKLPSLYQNKLETLQTMETSITKIDSRGMRTAKRVDELHDDYYKLFHTVMCKEEKKMIYQDKIESENLAEKFEVSLDSLNMITWKQHLPKITVIKNLNDDEEMETKKKLTIETITGLLGKYQDMNMRTKLLKLKHNGAKTSAFLKGPLGTKIIDPYQGFIVEAAQDSKTSLSLSPSKKNSSSSKKSNNVYQKVDRSYLLNYESSSDEEESLLNNAQDIRLYRKRKLFNKYKHPTVIINCGGFSIIAHPFQSPRIIPNKKK